MPAVPVPSGVTCAASESLFASWVSHFTQLIKHRSSWKLYDFYIDVASGATFKERHEFRQMLDDCENYRADSIINKKSAGSAGIRRKR